MAILIENIKELIQVENKPKMMVKGAEMAHLNTLKEAYLLIEGEVISAYGKMKDLNRENLISEKKNLQFIDASGKMVFPSFVDSHTHLVYAASREIEYIDKIKGLSYEEIAKRGGGILNSARKIQEDSEEELVDSAMKRLDEIIHFGTGAVEIKSGYKFPL